MEIYEDLVNVIDKIRKKIEEIRTVKGLNPPTPLQNEGGN